MCRYCNPQQGGFIDGGSSQTASSTSRTQWTQSPSTNQNQQTGFLNETPAPVVPQQQVPTPHFVAGLVFGFLSDEDRNRVTAQAFHSSGEVPPTPPQPQPVPERPGTCDLRPRAFRLREAQPRPQLLFLAHCSDRAMLLKLRELFDDGNLHFTFAPVFENEDVYEIYINALGRDYLMELDEDGSLESLGIELDD